MNSLFALIIFGLICLGSLLVVSWANHMENKKRLTKSRLRVLKSQFDELQQIIATVDQTVENRDVAKRLNQAAIEVAHDMAELEPSDGYVVAALNNAQALQEEFNVDNTKDRIYRIRESDSQIALAQSYLEKGATQLAHLEAGGTISPDEFNAYKLELSWARLMLPVLSYVAQGHQASNRNEPLPAKAFYEKAKVAVAHSGHPGPKKGQLQQELNEIINRQRQSLSVTLMSETQFNPDKPSPEENDSSVGENQSGEDNKEAPQSNDESTSAGP